MIWVFLIIAFGISSFFFLIAFQKHKQYKHKIIFINPSGQVNDIVKAKEVRDLNSNLIGYKPKGQKFVVIANKLDSKSSNGHMTIIRLSPHDNVYIPMKIKNGNAINKIRSKLSKNKYTTEEILKILVADTPNIDVDHAILESASEQEIVDQVSQNAVKEMEDRLRRSLTGKTLVLIIIGMGVAMGVIVGGVMYSTAVGLQPISIAQTEMARLNKEASENNAVMARVFEDSGLIEVMRDYYEIKANNLNQTMPVG